MFVCPQCEGKKAVKCPTCDGNGLRYFVPVLDFWESDCTECYGTGEVKCPCCDGVGEISGMLPASISQTPRAFAAACDQ